MPRNLIKRGNTYYFRIVVGGKKIRKALGSNLTEARRLAKILRERQRGIPVPAGTVKEFGERWLTEYIGRRRNEKGQKLARQRFRDYVIPVLPVLLREVKTEHISALSASIELSDQSVNHVLADIRCLLRYAEDVGEIARSPFPRWVMAQIPESEPKRLTRVEINKILGVASEPHQWAIRLTLETGLRWGELRRLQWRHVRELPEPHLVLEGTKNGRIRRVPLTVEAWTLLQGQRKRVRSVHVLPFRSKNACGIYYRIGKKAGVKWNWHQLRHTFASEWLEKGGSIETLSLMLGHSSVKVTERYGRISDPAMFAEVRRVESGPISGHTKRFTGPC